MKKLCAYIIVLLLLTGVIGMRKRYKRFKHDNNILAYQESPTAQYDEWHSEPSIGIGLMKEAESTGCDEILYCC